MAKDTQQRQDSTRPTGTRGDKAARRGRNFLGHRFGGMIATIVAAVVIVVVGKLTKIEQVHVATRSYAVDVKITQSVGVIPCFLVCNQMELKGSGTDDAVVNLSKLSRKDVTIDQSTDAVTVRMAAPVIGPADLNPAVCSITS